ncbi:hypothetical protein F4818DRAFT_439749 [Hypoxylon cercidicola]|nr:hypothetical protein F4818DRAFT_439749 [Hypoxylon cercidicola]
MIETVESIQNIDEIATVPGVEMLLIGSNDLSIELGVPGHFKSKEFQKLSAERLVLESASFLNSKIPGFWQDQPKKFE